MEPAPDSSLNSTISIKRKADEAFDALDNALRPRESRPPPKKTGISFYGSLAKYGIKPKSPSKVDPTPTLTALLSRARAKKERKPLGVSQPSPTSAVAPDYSPGSTDAFLQRLSTFNILTYPSKPQQIDAVAAAKAGWINEGGKDRLYCAICRVGWVLAGREGLSKEAANTLVEKQAQSLIDMHKEGCPWRTRQCDSLVYRIPLQSPANMARQVHAQAMELDSVMEGINLRHPLTSNQVQCFSQAVAAASKRSDVSSSSEPSRESPPERSPSTSALLTALFGWTSATLPPPLPRKSSTANLISSRTSSPSRAASVQADFSRTSTPIPCVTSLPATPVKSVTAAAAAPSSVSPDHTKSRVVVSQKDAMLQCKMCQRRIGLWAFAPPSVEISSSSVARPQRQLDVLREHRPYCPYVSKSTPFATFPTYRTSSTDEAGSQAGSAQKQGLQRTVSLISGVRNLGKSGHERTASSSSTAMQDLNLIEGWRAVFNTVLRYGIAERAENMYSLPSPTRRGAARPVAEEEAGSDDWDAMSGVIELVENVKQHGGKHILAYVRSLLG